MKLFTLMLDRLGAITRLRGEIKALKEENKRLKQRISALEHRALFSGMFSGITKRWS